MNKKIEIRPFKILAVEGKDEVRFFTKLLETMKIPDVQIVDVVGKTNFRNTLPTLIKDFIDVTIFGIVRDADDSASSSFQSLIDVLSDEDTKTANNQRLSLPQEVGSFSNGSPKVGIYILPNNIDEGALEDLCLDIIKVEYQKNLPCVHDFVTCLDEKPPSHQIGKVKIQALLASIYQHEGKAERIVAQIGIATERGYWNFDSENLSSLKNFLREFKS